MEPLTKYYFSYNIYFNGPSFKRGVNDIVADPMFVNLSKDALFANFALTSGSKAIDTGNKTGAATIDILGVVRPKGVEVDSGAYESY